MSESSVVIKDQNIFYTLLGMKADRKLIDVLCWMIFIKEWPVVVTDFFRKGSRGVHGTDPVRGLDIRSSIYADPRAVEFEVNENWVYDNTRPDKQVALYHNAGTGFHFHIQVHPLTEFIGSQHEFMKIRARLGSLL